MRICSSIFILIGAASARRKNDRFRETHSYYEFFPSSSFLKKHYMQDMDMSMSPTVPPSETQPSKPPSSAPTRQPSPSPTNAPSGMPTESPTPRPTGAPSLSPVTDPPTRSPTVSPTAGATSSPTLSPSFVPTLSPTPGPSPLPTSPGPTPSPTLPATNSPTSGPSPLPTSPEPTPSPTLPATNSPTPGPSPLPTSPAPTSSPTLPASNEPSMSPSMSPTTEPPTIPPSFLRTSSPTIPPSSSPTTVPSSLPTSVPSLGVTNEPTQLPVTEEPTPMPSDPPSLFPTSNPTQVPTIPQTLAPTACDVRISIPFDWGDDGIFVDSDASGDGVTPGDSYIFEENIIGNEGIGTTGLLSGRCVVLEDVEFFDNVYCILNLDFPEGGMAVQGLYRDDMNVIGGYGCYAGANGVMEDVTDEGFSIELDAEIPDECPDLDSLLSSTWIETFGDTAIDFDSSGDTSPGDFVVFDNNTIDAGGLSGIVSGECTLMQDLDSYCSISYNFGEAGTLTVQGLFETVMLVTGGTGCFDAVSEGYSVVAAVGAGSFEYIFELPFVSETLCDAGVFDVRWVEIGDDLTIDYDQNGVDSPGDTIIFDFNTITIGDDGPVGTISGVCQSIFSSSGETGFCQVLFTFDNGSLIAQGFYDGMTIVAGTGCFQDVTGVVSGSLEAGLFGYTFEITG